VSVDDRHGAGALGRDHRQDVSAREVGQGCGRLALESSTRLGRHGVGKTIVPSSTVAVEALKRGDFRELARLLSLGVDPNQVADDNSLLDWAVFTGNDDAVDLLLQFGADVNFQDPSGGTPLIYATLRGNVSIIDKLLSAGANINKENAEHLTPLMYAGDESVMKHIIDAGADIDLRNEFGSALHFCSKFGRYNLVKLLIDSGADPNIRNDTGYTPLHIAVVCGDFPDVVDLLISAGAATDTADNVRGMTPLMSAKLMGHQNSARVLASHGPG